MGVFNGEGEWTSNSVVMMKAGLCGSGLISIGSIPPGDEGKGGVVNTLSRRLAMLNALDENKDRRGVTNCGL